MYNGFFKLKRMRKTQHFFTLYCYCLSPYEGKVVSVVAYWCLRKEDLFYK